MWQDFETIRLSTNWQFTNPIEGELFKIPKGNPGFRALVAQVQVINSEVEFYQIREISGAETNVYQLIPPAPFDERCLAFKQILGDYNWNLSIKKWLPNPMIYPQLLNDWINYLDGYGLASYYKDRNRVYLEGLIVGGSYPSLVFNLQEGFRPSTNKIVGAKSLGGAVDLYINPLGEVFAGSSPAIQGQWMTLDNLSFRLDS